MWKVKRNSVIWKETEKNLTADKDNSRILPDVFPQQGGSDH